MCKWFVIPMLLLSGAASAATVWTWVDENGQRHFSDRPMPGATQMEIAGAQGFTPPPTPPAPADRSSGSDGEPQAPYSVLRIESPEHTETLWNIEGTLEVTVELTPSLRPGHLVDLYLDGERQYLDARRTSFTVPEVYRGVHALEAVVLDAGGNELMRSPTTNFVVQQTSVLNPNNPNN